jgi:asparagine synthase (glutamine-hydrolysing)
MASFLVYFSGSALRKLRYQKEASVVFEKEFLNGGRHGLPYSLSRNMRDLTIQEGCGAQLQRLLRFDDRIGSAFGMEGRPVFLDHRMIEFAISLPAKFKIRNGWTKFLIRRYLEMKGLPSIAWRKHKLGFPAPHSKWTSALLKTREHRLKESLFLKTILAPQIDIRNLDQRSAFKVLAIESSAIQLGWKVAEGN